MYPSDRYHDSVDPRSDVVCLVSRAEKIEMGIFSEQTFIKIMKYLNKRRMS